VGSFYIDPFNIKICKQVWFFKMDSELNTFFNKEEEFYKAPFVNVVTEKMSRIFYISFVQ
jgi:hypothetical protein